MRLPAAAGLAGPYLSSAVSREASAICVLVLHSWSCSHAVRCFLFSSCCGSLPKTAASAAAPTGLILVVGKAFE